MISTARDDPDRLMADHDFGDLATEVFNVLDGAVRREAVVVPV